MAKKSKKKSGDESEKPSKSKSTKISFVKKKKSTPRRNPDDSVSLMMMDLAGQALPVVVSFAGTHIVANVVGDRLLGGRSWSKHVKALTALASVAGLFFAGRTKALEKYQTGAVIGSSLAALQVIFQAYLPQIAWIFGPAPTYIVPPQPQQIAAPAKGRTATGDDDDGQDDDDLSDLGGIFSGASTGSGWIQADA